MQPCPLPTFVRHVPRFRYSIMSHALMVDVDWGLSQSPKHPYAFFRLIHFLAQILGITANLYRGRYTLKRGRQRSSDYWCLGQVESLTRAHVWHCLLDICRML